MKKVLVFLLACLTGTVMFAQTPQAGHHWAPVTSNETMRATSVVIIDDVEQANLQLEIGVFCVETGICRGSSLPANGPGGRKLYALAWYGEGDQQTHTYTFRLYDNANDQELNVIPPDPVTFVNG